MLRSASRRLFLKATVPSLMCWLHGRFAMSYFFRTDFVLAKRAMAAKKPGPKRGLRPLVLAMLVRHLKSLLLVFHRIAAF